MKNFRKIYSFLLVCLGLAALSSCGPKEQNIIIISTSDIHAKIDRLPQFAAFVDEVRQGQDTARVFLVDAGDRWTGNAYVDMATHVGRPIIEQMNRLGYDVATYGNHEFDFGLDTLQRRVEDAEFPIVLANVDTGDTPWEQPEPYVIRRVGGAKVGFLGLVTNYASGHPDGDDAIFEGTTFFSAAEAAERYGRKLRERVDVMVVISHLGLDRDTTDLVAAMPYADLVVSGHTHECYAAKKDGVMVVQGNSGLKTVGLTTIKLRGGEIVDLQSRYVDIPKEGGKMSVAAEVEAYKQNPELLKSVGALAESVDKNTLGNLMADVGRKVAGTDWGIYHIGGVRLGGLEAGDVCRADIFELEPFSSYYVITEMTLDDMKELIINKFNDTSNYKESHRVDLIPSGLEYTIITNSSGDAVDVKFRPEVRKEVYSVAISDYVYGASTYDYTRRPEQGRTDLVTSLLINHFGGQTITLDDSRRGEIK